ncbi:Hypothetical_protein [Hexamita inflata]|uniref:Hypothetical_protein n=1 Tax=Hexamita inflata TaxID=28002 RepID=A0AA86PJW9_9EUKA|nr:Hypothetical protein HINF_LOCUS26183 [Hexamita inflata]
MFVIQRCILEITSAQINANRSITIKYSVENEINSTISLYLITQWQHKEISFKQLQVVKSNKMQATFSCIDASSFLTCIDVFALYFQKFFTVNMELIVVDQSGKKFDFTYNIGQISQNTMEILVFSVIVAVFVLIIFIAVLWFSKSKSSYIDLRKYSQNDQIKLAVV